MSPNSSDRQRTFQWQDPMDTARHSVHLPGIELLRGIRDGSIPAPPLAHALDFGIHSVEEGHVVFEAEVKEYYYNPGGVVHGGVITTLLDSAMGSALLTHLDAGVGYGTVQLNVHMVRPVLLSTGTVQAIATTVHVGRSIGTVEARLVDLKGKLYAHGTCTCSIFPLKT